MKFVGSQWSWRDVSVGIGEITGSSFKMSVTCITASQPGRSHQQTKTETFLKGPG